MKYLNFNLGIFKLIFFKSRFYISLCFEKKMPIKKNLKILIKILEIKRRALHFNLSFQNKYFMLERNIF